MDFARAAEREPVLARQLHRFVSEVRCIFEADEIRFELARVEREQEEQELVSHDEKIFDPPPRRVSAAADWSMPSPHLAYFNLMTFVDVASAVSGRATLRRKPGETFHWRRSSVMTVTVRLL